MVDVLKLEREKLLSSLFSPQYASLHVSLTALSFILSSRMFLQVIRGREDWESCVLVVLSFSILENLKKLQNITCVCR